MARRPPPPPPPLLARETSAFPVAAPEAEDVRRFVGDVLWRGRGGRGLAGGRGYISINKKKFGGVAGKIGQLMTGPR